MTIRESAETTDGARDAARSRIPDGSRIDHEQVTRQPEVRAIRVSADDERAAHKQAQSQLDKWGRTDVIKKITLAIAGKRGFLGIGKTQNQYDIHAIRFAEVEIGFKPDAKISVTICQEEERNKEVYAAFERIWQEERDKLRDSTLENARVRPGQNWATVGAMAILQGMDNSADQSRKVALDLVATEYRMTHEELFPILQAKEKEPTETPKSSAPHPERWATKETLEEIIMAKCDRCKKEVPESDIVSIPGYRICRACSKALEQAVLGGFSVVTRIRS